SRKGNGSMMSREVARSWFIVTRQPFIFSCGVSRVIRIPWKSSFEFILTTRKAVSGGPQRPASPYRTDAYEESHRSIAWPASLPPSPRRRRLEATGDGVGGGRGDGGEGGARPRRAACPLTPIPSPPPHSDVDSPLSRQGGGEGSRGPPAIRVHA